MAFISVIAVSNAYIFSKAALMEVNIVLLGSYLYFVNFPKAIAIIGGLITIMGVLLIGFGEIKKQKKAVKNSLLKIE